MTACFGDLSGHLDPLVGALEGLGWRHHRPLPEGLRVVQVGDLVHKGPDSDRIVALIDGIISCDGPDRWVQLIGNHEAAHLGGPGFKSGCQCSPSTVATLRRWVRDGWAILAHPDRDRELGPVLVTHAGLSFDLWSRIGAPRDPAGAAAALNAMVSRPAVAFRPGRMLAGYAGEAAGVVWAESVMEVYRPWAARRAPFAQVHGHSSAVNWGRRSLSPLLGAELADTADIDFEARHARFEAGGAAFVGIDPGFGRYSPGRDMVPLILHHD